MENIEREFKEKGTISKNFTIPLLLWEEWEKDVKNNFNNTYHLKMKFDHEYRKNMAVFTDNILLHINELYEKIYQLEAKLEEKMVQDEQSLQKNKKVDTTENKSGSDTKKTFGDD